MYDTTERLDILNMIAVYSHLYDEGQFDEWLELFVEDAVFEFSGAAEATFSGRDEILNIPSAYREALARGEQGRHFLTNIAVLEQSNETADVAALALLSASSPTGEAIYDAPGRYTGRLVKTNDGWRIRQWRLHLDRPLG